MLPVINLDDQNFSDIFEEARKMIAGAYPGWTDYNEHDPGITFLELFSWFKEMQQYHLNQIGKDNHLMYLKLLGMKQERREPAQALIEISDNADAFDLPRGSRFYAGNITFETYEKERLETNRIIQCISRVKGKTTITEESVLNSGSYMKLYMFGNHPEKNSEFYIKFNQPFDTSDLHSIYFKIFEDYPIKRNKIEKDMYPLATLKVEYYSGGEWNKCEYTKDETYQFIRSGKIYFQCLGGMEPYEDAYCIRFTIEECFYDVPPILQQISTNVIYVGQKNTMAEYKDYVIKKDERTDYQIIADTYLALQGYQEIFLLEEQGYRPIYDFTTMKEKDKTILVLPRLFDEREAEKLTLRIVHYEEEFGINRTHEMDGFPYQKIDLEEDDILYGSFEILVENELFPGLYEPWEKVDNFYCSTQHDCHYVLDEERGEILFGNCENGKAPEGTLIIIGYATTFGMRGNVKAKQINQLMFANEEITVFNRDNAFGGTEKEMIDACFQRFMKEFRQVKRAITDEDYEEIVNGTPGLMIQNTKVIPVTLMKNRDGSIDENCVSIVVQQYTGGERVKLSEPYLHNIDQLLDRRRLVGTKMNILSPAYIGITVFGEIIVKPHYLNALDTIKAAVEEYFIESGNSFGKPVLYNEIYGIIDVLDCVTHVQNLSISSQGRGITRTMNGDLILPVNGLVYLKDADYFITSAE